VTLRVEAAGADLQFQWFRNATPISGATTSSLQVVANEADNGARYAVSVRNAAGEARSVDAVLTVTAALVPGISLFAGGIGGPGYLMGRGAQARLTAPDNIAIGKDGVVYFSCGTYVGKASAEGDVQFLAQFPYISVAGMACNSAGELYLCASGAGVIYKLVESSSPQFVVVAGKYQLFPQGGFVDGIGESARLLLPINPVFDKNNNLYFIDSGNRAIRKLTPSGQLVTVAGQPANQTAMDGSALAAGFASPTSMALLADGNLVVIDGALWRKVTPVGLVSTVPGASPASLSSLTVDGGGSLFAVHVDAGVCRLVRVAEDGSTTVIAGGATSGYAEGSATSAAFGRPLKAVAAPDGSLIVADTQNHLVRRVSTSNGQTSAWLGMAAQTGDEDGQGGSARFSGVSAMCKDASGNLYVIEKTRNVLRKITPAGVVTTVFERFPSDGGVAVDAQGNFYGVRNRAIYRVTPAGAEVLWAGQPGVVGFADGVAGSAQFANPMGLAFDRQGNLLVGDAPEKYTPYPFATKMNYKYGNTLRKITHEQVVTTMFGIPGKDYTQDQIDVMINAQDGGVSSTNPPATRVFFVAPSVIAVDASDQIWVMDSRGILFHAAPDAPQVWVSIGTPGRAPTPYRPTAFALSSDGTLYLAVGGESEIAGSSIRKWSRQAMAPYTRIAGQSEFSSYSLGVRLGGLPSTLASVPVLMMQDANTLICFSENALLKVQVS